MKTLITSMMLAVTALLWGCGPSSSDSKEKADSANEALTDAARDTHAINAVDEDDARFAVDAANGGLTEVQLGKVAQDKGSDPRVKEFGKMMVDHHTKANDELKAIAADKNITLPATPGEDMEKNIADISSKSGKDFDKAYIKQMVKDHEKTVKLFEDGQKNVKDAEIRAFIDKTLPVLKSHLDQIRNLDKAK